MFNKAHKRKTLFLHAGTDKTGTTALQIFLRDNAEALAERGLAYLSTGRGQDHNHDALYRRTVEGDDSVWDDLAEELRASPHRCGAISFEGFYHLDEARLRRIRERLAGIRVVAILYLRRQSDMVRSGLVQRIKEGGEYLPFEEYAPENLFGYGQDYRPILERFARAFGRECVDARRYEAFRWPEGSLFLDFLGAMGVVLDGRMLRQAFRLPQRDPNPTLDVDAVHLLATLDQWGIDAARRRSAVGLLLAEMGGERSTAVTDRLAADVDAHFAASNRAIAQSWFGEDELFVEPSRFVFRQPKDAGIAAHFLLLRHWMPLVDLPRWRGNRQAPRRLAAEGKLHLQAGWSRSRQQIRVQRQTATMVFRAQGASHADLHLRLEGRWAGVAGRLSIAANGEPIYRGESPDCAAILPCWLHERRLQLVELALAVTPRSGQGPAPAYLLEAMSYAVAPAEPGGN